MGEIVPNYSRLVVGDMLELNRVGDVAERKDAVDVGSQLCVGDEIPGTVELVAVLSELELVAVRYASGRNEDFVDAKLVVVGEEVEHDVVAIAANRVFGEIIRPRDMALGLVATAGTTYVQDEEVTSLGIGAAVPVGLLAVALLITNNLRDRPKDEAAGKKTLAVRMGDQATRVVFTGVVVAVFLTLPYLAIVRWGALLGLLAVPLAVSPVRAVLRGAAGPALIPVLGATGRLQLATGLLLTVGLAASG